MNKTLFVISCKESNLIYDCVQSIKNNYGNEVDIVIVDSCSADKKYFELKEKYSNLFIEDVCNRNYEYGAIVYGFKKHNQYENYAFIQDAIRFKQRIVAIENIEDGKILLFGDHNKNTGWTLDPDAKSYFHRKNPSFPSVDGNFSMAEWNSFCVNRNTFERLINSEIFISATIPENKMGSRAWERVWGVLFLKNNIQVEHIDEGSFGKVWGNRQ